MLKKRVVSYCDLLNRHFETNQMDYSIGIDSTFGMLDELPKDQKVFFTDQNQYPADRKK